MTLTSVDYEDFKDLIIKVRSNKKPVNRKKPHNNKPMFDEIAKSGNVITRLDNVLELYSNANSAYCSIKEALRQYSYPFKILKVKDEIYIINTKLIPEEFWYL